MSHSVDRLAQLQRMVFFFSPPAKEDVFAKVRILQIIILTLNPCTNYPDIFSALRSAAGLAPDRFFLLCLDPTAPIPCPGFQFNANARLPHWASVSFSFPVFLGQFSNSIRSCFVAPCVLRPLHRSAGRAGPDKGGYFLRCRVVSCQVLRPSPHHIKEWVSQDLRAGPLLSRFPGSGSTVVSPLFDQRP